MTIIDPFAPYQGDLPDSPFTRTSQRGQYLPPSLTFDYLPLGWQQCDTRPWTYPVDTRQDAKDTMRTSVANWMGEKDQYRSVWRRNIPTHYPRDNYAHDPYRNRTHEVWKTI